MRNKSEKWEKLRAKGKWNFILKYGVLLWGVGTAVLFSLFFPMVMGGKGQSSSDLPPLNSTISRERIWGWSKPREATNATRKEGTG